MALDPTIPFRAIGPVQARQAVQNSEMKGLQIKQAKSNMAENEAMKPLRMRAAEQNQGMADLDENIKRSDLTMRLLSSAKDQSSYDRAIKLAQGYDLDVSQLPPQYDPQIVDQMGRATMTYMQQLNAERQSSMDDLSREKFDFDKQKFAEKKMQPAGYTGGGDTGRMVDRLIQEGSASDVGEALQILKGGAGARGRLAPEAQKMSNKDFIDKSYRPTLDAARGASQANARLDALQSIDLTTGWGTEAKAGAANILASFGIAPESAKQLTANSQIFNAIVSKEVNEELMLQKGPQTEGDSQRAFNIQAQLGNRPEANQFIIDMARALNDQKIKKAKFFSQNRKRATDAGDLASLDLEWQEQQGSIFDKPSMQKWGDQGGKAQQGEDPITAELRRRGAL